MSLEYRIGDVRDRLAEIGDGSIDLIVTSPPFLALRSYLPADHPDKGKEIGSEATPAAFIDTLLQLTAEFGRVLAPHGSLCVELGDTYSGSGGAGGDYNVDGWRENQPPFTGSGLANRGRKRAELGNAPDRHARGSGWPLAKSLTGIPQSYMLSLVYGWNVLDRHGPDSPAGRWRARNQIVWARPNPPVGALGDKFRPATSYITIACRGIKRFFDLDAVRTPGSTNNHATGTVKPGVREFNRSDVVSTEREDAGRGDAGAPPLDWHQDLEDGDWLWKLPTRPYKGAHYATFPLELPTRLIMAMCPLRVCVECGKPSERITSDRSAFDVQPVLAVHIKERREAAGVTSAQINERLGYKEIAKNWERTDKHGAAIPNAADWAIIKPWLGLSDEFDEAVTGERRWTESTTTYEMGGSNGEKAQTARESGFSPHMLNRADAIRSDLGWSDCGHNQWRTGTVLDPFAGSGTTLQAAQNVGRHAIGIDLDPRNAELARNRVGMFMSVDEGVDA